MNHRNPTCFLLGLIALTASVSCRKTDSATGLPVPKADGAATAEPGGHAEAGHESKAEAAEKSDLDRPIEELASLTCEHEKKTFECEECRYEVGFVRVPASLTREGLVSVAKAERMQVAVPIALTGEVRFDERRVGHVSSQVEGIVKIARVKLGDKVKKGQALIEIESVAVGEAQAAYLEAQSLLTLARREFERVSTLRKENIASEKEILQAKQELEAAEIHVESAIGRLIRLGTSPADAQALTRAASGGRLVLRSPVDGSVLALHAVPGETAKTEESLVTVGDNSTVWVWADVYDRDIHSITLGQSGGKLAASVSVKAYPGEEFTGTVDLVTQAMEESSRTVKVRVEVENSGGRLLSGMFAAVNLFLPGKDEALAVPRDAVLEDEGRSFVFVHHRGDDFVRRPVVVGRTWAAWTEIKSGLQPGQAVVSKGGFLLKSDVLRKKMGAGCAD
jgi:cobalt-zinc-cadmium efflux system membrane fusion protein